MRRIFILLTCLAASFPVFAQTTAWPYLYPDFQTGTIVMSDGKEQRATVNVHLLKGDLHFIDDKGVIQMAPAVQFTGVRIGEASFRRIEGYLMQVLPGPDEGNFIALRRTADLSALNETGGAYGVSSTTSSTRKITSIDLPGMVNTSHMEIMQNREYGQKLKIKSEYFIVLDGKVIKASKKDVGEAVSAERAAEFKQFLKKNKINWKDENSLLTLFDFFKQ